MFVSAGSVDRRRWQSSKRPVRPHSRQQSKHKRRTAHTSRTITRVVKPSTLSWPRCAKIVALLLSFFSILCALEHLPCCCPTRDLLPYKRKLETTFKVKTLHTTHMRRSWQQQQPQQCPHSTAARHAPEWAREQSSISAISRKGTRSSLCGSHYFRAGHRYTPFLPIEAAGSDALAPSCRPLER